MKQAPSTDTMNAYRQKSGEITAWFPDAEEKIALCHEGSPAYRKTFYILVAGGLLYLLVVFMIY